MCSALPGHREPALAHSQFPLTGARFAVAALLVACMSARAATDCAQPAAVCDHAVHGALALIDGGKVATILADSADFPGVLRAARDLQGDLSAVAGSSATLSTNAKSD